MEKCYEHSGLVESMRAHSKRIDLVSAELDTHLMEHRQNSRMILISTITSSIAAAASLVTILLRA